MWFSASPTWLCMSIAWRPLSLLPGGISPGGGGVATAAQAAGGQTADTMEAIEALPTVRRVLVAASWQLGRQRVLQLQQQQQ